MQNRNAMARAELGRELIIEPELAEAVREVIGSAESPNTRRAYAAQGAKFEAWCTRRGTKALPATPVVVATYLVDLAKTGADPTKPGKGAKVATVSLALSAISAAHRAAGLELDTKAREIRATMKGIRKTYAAPQAQAEALKPAIVRGILATLGDSPLERRDAALVALLFAAALRRSELAGLDYALAGDGDGYLRLTGEAVELVLLRSKARTEPATVLVPRENNPGLVAALERWIAVAGIKPGGPLFRSIKKAATSVGGSGMAA
jgi:site-specific recombinase XerD